MPVPGCAPGWAMPDGVLRAAIDWSIDASAPAIVRSVFVRGRRRMRGAPLRAYVMRADAVTLFSTVGFLAGFAAGFSATCSGSPGSGAG